MVGFLINFHEATRLGVWGRLRRVYKQEGATPAEMTCDLVALTRKHASENQVLADAEKVIGNQDAVDQYGQRRDLDLHILNMLTGN